MERNKKHESSEITFSKKIGETDKTKMRIGKRLLEILVCPQCRGKLDPEEGKGGLHCATCKLRYEIRDGIPILLIDQAAKWDDEPGNDSRQAS
jgi:uncharacterized protein